MKTHNRRINKVSKVTLPGSDALDLPDTQVKFHDKVQQVVMLLPYGFTCNAPLGNLGINMQINGDPTNVGCIPLSEANRVKELKPGEVAIGNWVTGSVVIFLENGDIEVVCKRDLTATVEGDASVKVKGDMTTDVEGNLTSFVGGNVSETVAGNVTANVVGAISLTSSGMTHVGDLTVNGNTTITGNLTVGGVITGSLVTAPVIAGATIAGAITDTSSGLSFSAHVHFTDGDPGNTGVPI